MKWLILLIIPLAVFTGCGYEGLFRSNEPARKVWDKPCWNCKGSGWKMGRTCPWCEGSGIARW